MTESGSRRPPSPSGDGHVRYCHHLASISSAVMRWPAAEWVSQPRRTRRNRPSRNLSGRAAATRTSGIPSWTASGSRPAVAAAPPTSDGVPVGALEGSALVSAEAERVAGWIDQHAHVLLWLMLGDGRSECDRVGDGRVKVVDLKVEVHHRTVLS